VNTWQFVIPNIQPEFVDILLQDPRSYVANIENIFRYRSRVSVDQISQLMHTKLKWKPRPAKEILEDGTPEEVAQLHQLNKMIQDICWYESTIELG